MGLRRLEEAQGQLQARASRAAQADPAGLRAREQATVATRDAARVAEREALIDSLRESLLQLAGTRCSARARGACCLLRGARVRPAAPVGKDAAGAGRCPLGAPASGGRQSRPLSKVGCREDFHEPSLQYEESLQQLQTRLQEDLTPASSQASLAEDLPPPEQRPTERPSRQSQRPAVQPQQQPVSALYAGAGVQLDTAWVQPGRQPAAPAGLQQSADRLGSPGPPGQSQPGSGRPARPSALPTSPDAWRSPAPGPAAAAAAHGQVALAARARQSAGPAQAVCRPTRARSQAVQRGAGSELCLSPRSAEAGGVSQPAARSSRSARAGAAAAPSSQRGQASSRPTDTQPVPAAACSQPQSSRQSQPGGPGPVPGSRRPSWGAAEAALRPLVARLTDSDHEQQQTSARSRPPTTAEQPGGRDRLAAEHQAPAGQAAGARPSGTAAPPGSARQTADRSRGGGGSFAFPCTSDSVLQQPGMPSPDGAHGAAQPPSRRPTGASEAAATQPGGQQASRRASQAGPPALSSTWEVEEIRLQLQELQAKHVAALQELQVLQSNALRWGPSLASRLPSCPACQHGWWPPWGGCRGSALLGTSDQPPLQ